MKCRTQFAVALFLLLPASLLASDIAVLRNGFTIRHEWREQIGTVTRLYTTSSRSSYVDIPSADIEEFQRDLSPAALPRAAAGKTAVPAATNAEKIDELISITSSRHKLDPDFLSSVIRAESGFNPHAVSNKGAQGLMQLMPQTASQLGVDDAFDPQANVEGGTRYLRELLERYNFDVVKALAAYNAGPYRVDRYHGVPPYYETQAYIARIIRDYNRKKLAEQKAAKAADRSVRKPASIVKSQAKASVASLKTRPGSTAGASASPSPSQSGSN